MIEKWMKFKNFLKKLVDEHTSVILFVGVLFVIAVIFGAIVVNSMGITQRQNLYDYITRFFSEVINGDEDLFSNNFWSAYVGNLKTFLLIWILGISVIGFPLTLLILFVRGIVIGFTVGFLVNQAGWKGFLLACSTVLPHNLIIMPLMIIITGASLVISFKMIKRQFRKEDYEPLLKYLYFYLLLLGMGLLLLMLATWIEVYISPWLMKKLIVSM